MITVTVQVYGVMSKKRSILLETILLSFQPPVILEAVGSHDFTFLCPSFGSTQNLGTYRSRKHSANWHQSDRTARLRLCTLVLMLVVRVLKHQNFLYAVWGITPVRPEMMQGCV